MLPVALAFFSFTRFLMSKRWLMPEDRKAYSSFSTCELSSQSNYFGNYLVLLYFEIKGGDRFAVKIYLRRDAIKFRSLQKLQNTRKSQKLNTRKGIMCPCLFQPPQFFLCRCSLTGLHSHSRSAHWSNHLKSQSETALRSSEQHHLYTTV